MNIRSASKAIAFTALLTAQAQATDNLLLSQPTTQQLILVVDTSTLLPSKDEATLQENESTDTKLVLASQIDAVSKKLKSASKAFKRLTSLRYGKQQKIRAKLGKASVTLKYTRIL